MESRQLEKQTPSDVLREQTAILALALGLNQKEVAKFVQDAFAMEKPPGIRWVARIAEEKLEDIERIRNERYQKEVSQFDQKIQMLIDGITEDKIGRAQLHSITTALGTLYDKRALARGESTNNVAIKGMMLQKDISSMSDEDLAAFLAKKSSQYAESEKMEKEKQKLKRRRTSV